MNAVTNTERCNLHKLIKKVSMKTSKTCLSRITLLSLTLWTRFLGYKVSFKVLTGDTALMKYSKEDESEAAMLQGNVSELLILVRKAGLWYIMKIILTTSRTDRSFLPLGPSCFKRIQPWRSSSWCCRGARIESAGCAYLPARIQSTDHFRVLSLLLGGRSIPAC